MTDQIIQEKKFTCTNTDCDFENYIPGYCPQCEEGYLRKVCECKSGKFASECCEPEMEKVEKEMEAKIASDFNKEKIKELTAEEKAEQKRIEEEERLFREAAKESEDEE
jgi:hypothetical protein